MKHALFRLASVAAVGCAFAAWPAIAEAREPSQSELQLAKDMMRDAIVERGKGHCEDAIAMLKQAAAIRSSTTILLNMGACMIETGELREALSTLEQAEDDAREERDKSAQKELVGLLATVRDRIPSVSLVMPDVKGAKVAIDGEAVPDDKLDRPVPLDPGEHTVTAEAPGRVAFLKKVTLAEKQSLALSVTLPEPPPADEGGPRIPVVTWVAGSAAVALGAGGAVAFLVSGGVASDGEATCARQPTCDTSSKDAVHKLDSAALGLWIGAGVAAGVAVTWFLLEGGGGPEKGASVSARLTPLSLSVSGTY